MTALLVAGTLLWTAGCLGVWAKRQALETDNWVDTSAELLENEPIRTALAALLVDRLYASAAVSDRLQEALPPRLQGLADPAAAGLQELARRNVPRVLGSAAALGAWENANRAAHSELLRVVEGELADRGISLDLKSLFQEVAAGTGLPPSAVDRLPPNVADLQVASSDELEQVRDLLHLFKTIVWVLVGLAVAAFAGAIALAQDRRRAAVNVGACIVFAAVAVLAFRALAGKWVVDSLADAPNAHDIADDVWSIATRLMVDVAQGSFLFGAFIVLGAWLIGPGRRAIAARRISATALREHAGYTRAALGALLLLLVIWGPVPWTQRIWPMLVFTLLAFVWLERVRAVSSPLTTQPPPQTPAS